MDREYKANRVVVRERLYRDAVERALGGAGKIRWVPAAHRWQLPWVPHTDFVVRCWRPARRAGEDENE